MAMTRSCRMPRVRENSRLGSEVWACSASRILSYSVNAGSTLVIWNFRLMPARARSAGGARVISLPPKVTVPAVGTSAPATHFISVLLPKPFGPIRPWNSFSAMLRLAPLSAVSFPNVLTMPVASSSVITVSLGPYDHGPLERATEPSHALPLVQDKSDQAGGPEHD